MPYNKSYVQLTMAKMLDFVINKWNDEMPRNFTRFFSIAKSVMPEWDIKELNERIRELEAKYQMKIQAIEIYVWQMKFQPRRVLLVENIIKNGLGNGWDLKVKTILNHFEMERDLTALREWCLFQLHIFAERNNINFDRIPELYSEQQF